MLNYAFQDPTKSVKTSSKERLKCQDSLFAAFCLYTGKIHKYIFIPALCLVEIWIYHTFCWVLVGRQLVKELEQSPSILLCLIKNPSGAGSELVCYWQGLFRAPLLLCKTLCFLHYHRVRSLWAETWEMVWKVNMKWCETVALVKGISPRGCWLPGFGYSRSSFSLHWGLAHRLLLCLLITIINSEVPVSPVL